MFCREDYIYSEISFIILLYSEMHYSFKMKGGG